MRGLGCVGIVLAFALAAGLVVSTAPGLVALLGVYGFVIGKGAVDGFVGQPVLATLVSFDPRPVNESGDIGNAVVEYGNGSPALRARVNLLPRPISSTYRIGQEVPVLVNRADPSRAKYDMMWMHRAEHQARLAPIWKMAIDNSSRSKASLP